MIFTCVKIEQFLIVFLMEADLKEGNEWGGSFDLQTI